MPRKTIRALIAVLGALLVAAPGALASGSGAEHLRFAAGPYTITPGANLILLDANQVPKPHVDGYMVRMAPNIRYALPGGRCCGAVPRTDLIHLHHAVWLSNGTPGQGEGSGTGGFYPFFATGEEKTIYSLPHGYGYQVGARDSWLLNYMLHNLTARAAKVYVTYDLSFVPASSPTAARMKVAHPIWMDVMAHHIYPVFDVHRGSGRHGRLTFPEMARRPYGAGTPLNQFTIDHPGVLLDTAGHVHPGGLWSELDLLRPLVRRAPGTIPGLYPSSVRLFRSHAYYWDPRGPISWDMAMTATAADWRPAVRAGDVLQVSATYETRRASWYESMGIMVVWEAWNDAGGTDPFAHALDQRGHLTHGHLRENDHYGGAVSAMTRLQPAVSFRRCRRRTVVIRGFLYNPGDSAATGADRCIPTVAQGHSLRFVNDDALRYSLSENPFAILNPNPLYLASIFHTVTACRFPCSRTTGLSYPIANGSGSFDSGQLGLGLPAVGRLSWSTPAGLRPGTYTYFCRIHPFMRGVFQIIR